MKKVVVRAMAGAVLCAALLVAAPGAAGAAGGRPFLFAISKFTPEVNKIERFENPCGLAVDMNGALYVSDYYHHKIDVFTPVGGTSTKLLTKLTEVEPLNGPCGLAVEPSGNLLVNAFHGGVSAYSPAAFPITSNTAYALPSPLDPGPATGVSIDPSSGWIYVDERTYVAVYEASGAAVEVAGQPLRIGLGTLGDGYGVAVSAFPGTAGFVYVPDAASNTIEVYDPATDPVNPIASIGGQGTPQGEFKTLRDAAVAIEQATGHLFVAWNAQGPFYEHPEAAVAEFNAAGEYRGTPASPTPLRFGGPAGIAVDDSGGATAGRVYVTTGDSEMETVGTGSEKMEESAIYAFGPGVPGKRLEATLSGAGAGTLKSTPAGIACPGACAAEYDEGTVVKLTAVPAPGSVFVGWSGAGCSGTGDCTVLMSAAQAVSAEFGVAPPPASEGEGSESDQASTAASAAVPDSGKLDPARPTSARGTKHRRRAKHSRRHVARGGRHR